MEGNNKKPHIILGPIGVPKSYTYPRDVRSNTNIPEQNRSVHGSALQRQLSEVERVQERMLEDQSGIELESGNGIQIAFESFPGVEMVVESLADARRGIELLSVKKSDGKTIASVYVPTGQLRVLESKIEAYIERKTDSAGRPRDNRKLIDSIHSLRLAALESLWTDERSLLPNDNEIIWWEVWLPVLTDRNAVLNDFKKLAGLAEMEVSDRPLEFPERSVVLARGSKRQLAGSSLLLSKISELRKAKETAAFFDELDPSEQREWSNDLLQRVNTSEESEEARAHICILDTGINTSHPLLTQFISPSDTFTVNPNWGSADENGHGTCMAGLALWGDLAEPLESQGYVTVNHKLESVKLLRFSGDNEGVHLGRLTADGVSLPDISFPYRRRIYSMALSSLDGRDRGRPSAWSSQMDSLAVDYLGENQHPKLFVVCAGNAGHSLSDLVEYPSYNDLQDIHDPGQSWNAITVGAYTQKVMLTEPGSYTPLAPAGGLSPYSTTSVLWEKSMPIKPEVVFEGGNVGKDRFGCAGLPSLKLLSTYNNINDRLFTTAEATSASTQLGAKFCADILSTYPSLWPETVRAMMIHSADWTDQMKAQFGQPGMTEKRKAKELLRRVGYGVPSLEKALWSANNSLSLIVEDTIRPYEKKKSKQPTTRDMNIHELPWPKDVLLQLGEVEVKMVVTLSYFIEPNPSSRNVSGKYSYPSHQLRFDVKRSAESNNDFLSRLSRSALQTEHGSSTPPTDSNWLLGDFKHRGSIHKDIWKGSAADLAERGHIAVYPAMGWWRTRTQLQRWDKDARYSLVVSISTEEVEVDLYSEVATLIESKVEVEA